VNVSGTARQPPAPPFAEEAMARATASERIDGNRLVLQFDGPSTFDSWLDAIAGAEEFIHFENYILRNDLVGREFREALIERARAGVQVRVLHDWVGCWATPRRFWRPFREAGVEVRAFNPPSIRDPFGLPQRDHRKLVVVDGKVAFIGGFCVGQEWAGTRDQPPWRDTGVQIQGPAVAHAARTFQRIWAELGPPVPRELEVDPGRILGQGESAVWLIEGLPWRSRVYRATQLLASVARERIWITDPYFVAPRTVAEALGAAARDGVDVRILLPAHNNWPLVGRLSRGGYRSLLEAGVRIFEWEGPMIHAKTAVVDGRWSRIGSSNLNAASLLGNWELDVGILDPAMASQMEALFLADLTSAVEIVLPRRATSTAREAGAPGPSVESAAVRPVAHHGSGLQGPGGEREGEVQSPDRDEGDPGHGVASLDREGSLQDRWRAWTRSAPGSRILTLPDLVRAGSSLGDAIAGRRVVGPEDRTVLGTTAALLLIGAGVSAFLPRFVGWTLAVLLGWFGLVLGFRAGLQAWRARHESATPSDPEQEANPQGKGEERT
jgi:cardiolipin synthase A/B